MANDLTVVKELRRVREQVDFELSKAIVGQKGVIGELLICLLAQGHGLIIGVPGLAKTLLVNTLARILNLSFNRIQFTPDLMPSDITGTEILDEDPVSGKRGFRFVKGPIFANVVLADEINRTPPKTQAALLQAMQEYRVTVGGVTYPLDRPFFVLATQNPIEQEGTYPLPEAQLDRFMFSIYIDYPSALEEEEIVQTTTSAYEPELEKILDAPKILELQRLVRRVPVAQEVVSYAVKLVNLTRPSQDGLKFVRDWVSWGAGPRASQYLILGAKTRAVLDGRYTPTVEDIRAVAQPVLRHRLVTSFAAEAEGVRPGEIVSRLLKEL
jgi:MoxR-like ATPase